MDASRLARALDYGTGELGFAVRVYRHGCLVGEDRLAPANRNTRFESWSMAKSVTSLMFGRAMQLGLISPDDPVGSLLPEADLPHGAITMRDLLTMTSGLEWNGFRDYNVFTGFDRIKDSLTLNTVRRPGTFFEYAQSPVALLAEAVGRAAGTDAGAFAQRELMGPLGIEPGSWSWTRDRAGHIGGFYGVQMRPDDYGRLGELMRRNGMWRGQRLLSRVYTRQAITPSDTNGCYGWLIWLNAGSPCVGPRITERPVDQGREFPDLPADLYRFSGLFGQLVTVFPTQGIVVVRNGQDRGLVFSGGTSWEHELYRRVLGSVTDQRIVAPGPAPEGGDADDPNADQGFQNAIRQPGRYRQGALPDTLPPAGPARARAARLSLARPRVGRRGRAVVRVSCPPRWPAALPGACVGMTRFEGSRAGTRHRVAAGKSRVVRVRVGRKALRRLRRRGRMSLRLRARNVDAAFGTVTLTPVTLKRPARARRR